MSGLSRTPGKRVRVNTLRGFESRLLRQNYSIYGPSGPVLLFYPLVTRLYTRVIPNVASPTNYRR